jgi:hypothetical protein
VNRKKARSIIKVADGTGGLTTLTDRRFEKPAAWPVQFEVPTAQEQADRWLRYLTAECSRRGWSTGGLGELGRGENSGTVNIIGSGQALLDVVWERRRDGPLKVRARPSASSVLALPDVERLLNEITLQCGSRATERIYARGTLHYEGMAWRGELWLDGSIRLGPPSLQDETATIGPRILHVDAMLECIGQSDVPTAREQLLLEVSAFLSVVMRTAVRLPDQGRTWTWEFGVDGCEVRHLGYMEVRNPLAMPARGTDAEMPLYVGDPPNFFDGTSNEIALRADVVDLWRLYRGLTVEWRFQFLQSASKWQEALIHWQDRPSLSFALMVVACEALKPSHADERLNCYHVVEALSRSVAS